MCWLSLRVSLCQIMKSCLSIVYGQHFVVISEKVRNIGYGKSIVKVTEWNNSRD